MTLVFCPRTTRMTTHSHTSISTRKSSTYVTMITHACLPENRENCTSRNFLSNRSSSYKGVTCTSFCQTKKFSGTAFNLKTLDGKFQIFSICRMDRETWCEGQGGVCRCQPIFDLIPSKDSPWPPNSGTASKSFKSHCFQAEFPAPQKGAFSNLSPRSLISFRRICGSVTPDMLTVWT